jgi:hypothetical protein
MSSSEDSAGDAWVWGVTPEELEADGESEGDTLLTEEDVHAPRPNIGIADTRPR